MPHSFSEGNPELCLHDSFLRGLSKEWNCHLFNAIPQSFCSLRLHFELESSYSRSYQLLLALKEICQHLSYCVTHGEIISNYPWMAWYRYRNTDVKIFFRAKAASCLVFRLVHRITHRLLCCFGFGLRILREIYDRPFSFEGQRILWNLLELLLHLLFLTFN